MRTKKLISFDFDDTLVKTPLPEEGKIVWKEVTGYDWKHKGWWSKPESLDMEVFDIPLNKHIYKDYKKILSDPENYIILATGRITALRNEVNNILDYYGLDFDEIHLNPGMDTFEFKKQLFENLIDNIQPEEFIMYDDRDEHLVKFVEWAKTLPCKTTIIDAKTGQVFEGNKDIKESIKRILREETRLNTTIRRRVLYDDLEREFEESLEMSSNMLRNKYKNSGEILSLERFIDVTISILMDGIHYDIHITMPNEYQWYDEVVENLKNYFRNRIVNKYRKLISEI